MFGISSRGRMRFLIVSFLVFSTSRAYQHTKGSSETDQADSPMQLKLRRLLKFYGNDKLDELLRAPLQESHFTELIEQFQTDLGLLVTGRMDQNTTRLLEVPMCGNVKFEPNQNGLQIRANKLVRKDIKKWPRITLTWRIVRYSKKLKAEDFHRIISESFKEWSRVGGFIFREELNPWSLVHMYIGFYRGFHFDDNPFDGKGGKLAHAFYPDNHGRKGRMEGDIHFDDDEEWDSRQNLTDLHWIALHEIGHSLGLQHNLNNSTLMFPFHGLLEGEPRVTEGDIEELKKLYNSGSLFPNRLNSLASWFAVVLATSVFRNILH